VLAEKTPTRASFYLWLQDHPMAFRLHNRCNFPNIFNFRPIESYPDDPSPSGDSLHDETGSKTGNDANQRHFKDVRLVFKNTLSLSLSLRYTHTHTLSPYQFNSIQIVLYCHDNCFNVLPKHFQSSYMYTNIHKLKIEKIKTVIRTINQHFRIL